MMYNLIDQNDNISKTLDLRQYYRDERDETGDNMKDFKLKSEFVNKIGNTRTTDAKTELSLKHNFGRIILGEFLKYS